jgi:hypothetical protein
MLELQVIEELGEKITHIEEKYGEEVKDAFIKATMKVDKIEQLPKKFKEIADWALSNKINKATTFGELIEKKKTSAVTFSNIVKYNPFHDGKGRFSSKGTGGAKNGGKFTPDYKQIMKLAPEAIDKATADEPEITTLLESVVEGTGSGRLEGLEFKLKEEDSLKEKLEKECLKHEISPQKALSTMNDLNRYTYIDTEDNLLSNTNYVLKSFEQKGYTVARVKNSLVDVNADYRGINTVLISPNGRKFELQFHTKASFDVKMSNHKLYEEQRKPGTTEKRYLELKKEMNIAAKAIPTPAGIGNLKSFTTFADDTI